MSLIKKLKLRLRRDRGVVLLEAAIAMGLLGFVISGFAISSTTTQQVQSTAVNHGIGIQAAQGVVEQARSSTWEKLAVKAAPVNGSTEIRENGGIVPATSTVTVRGLPVTLTTTITWKNNKPHEAGKHPYSSKLITVTASWDEMGVKQTAPPQQALLTPSISEVPPAGIVEVK